MKKIIAMLLVFALIFCTAGCSGGKKTVLEVNLCDVVDEEIFTYFLNEALYSASDMTEQECIEAATSEGLKYAAVNTHFVESGETLSLDDKALVAAEVNALWRSYGKYYESIGVSKDAFFKIKQYEYRKESIRLALYDSDGEKPIAESLIEQYFTSNYFGIKYFYQELYTPVSSEELDAMSESEKASYEAVKQAAQERYADISAVADDVNSGYISIDSAFMLVTGEVSADISVSASVVGRSDSKFSDEFVEAVSRQAVGSAFIITNPDRSYVYFIERVDLLSDKYDFYSQYRLQCLRAVSEQFFVGEINEWIKTYAVVRDYALAQRLLRKISSLDRSGFIGTDEYAFSPLPAEE